MEDKLKMTLVVHFRMIKRQIKDDLRLKMDIKGELKAN